MPAPARPRIELLHRALAAGVVFALLVFGFLLYRGIAPLLPAETPRDLIAMIMSLASLLSLGVALFLLKGKVPPPSSHETTEAYLRRDDVMVRALLFWAQCEAAALVGAVGLVLAGAAAPAVTACAALAVLLFHGPSYFATR